MFCMSRFCIFYIVTCPVINFPSSEGKAIWHTDGQVTSVSYTCLAGYTLKGEVTSACLASGQWSATTPTCGQFFAHTEINDFVIVKLFVNWQIHDRSTKTIEIMIYSGLMIWVQFICAVLNVHSMLMHSAQSINQCSVSVTCDTLYPLASGDVSLTSNGTVSIAIYTCAAGYNLVGISSRFCGEDGTWNVIDPSCGK